MKSKLKLEASFIRRIIMVYLAFSMLFILMLLGFTEYAYYHQSRPHVDRRMRKVAEEFAGKTTDKFANVNVNKILGEGSFVQILDGDNKVVYSSNGSDMNLHYSNAELDMISNDDENIDYELEPFYDTNTGRHMTLVSIHHIHKYDSYLKVLLLDDKNNICFSSVQEKLPEGKQAQIHHLNITSDVPLNYTITKSTFLDSNGKKMTAIAFVPITWITKLTRLYSSYTGYITLFLIIYFTLVALVCRWIYITMKKPLASLDGAMRKVAEGSVGATVEYDGDKEFNDICETFNEMSRRLKESGDTNERLQREKEAIIGAIGHDFKTPLTVIKGYAEALKDGYISEEEKNQFLDIIISKTDDLATLVSELKTYNKAEDREIHHEFQRIDLAEHLRYYLAKYYNEFQISGYELVADIPEDSIFAEIEVRMIDRVMDNLMGNFFKHNGNATTFFCRVRESADKVFITVGDDGAGIPKEIRDEVFEPFVMGDESRQNQGSGLGLYTVKQIIEKHGGKIRLVDGAISGLTTVFIMTIPKKKS